MKPLLNLAILAIIFVSTPQVHAQQAQLDTFQKPDRTADGTIVDGKGFVPCSGTDCSPCDLVVMFNTIIKWFMVMVFILFAFLAIKSGLKMVTSGNPGSLNDAKKSFVNAFLGLAIMLCAWLIVDLLMTKLLNGGNLDAVYSGFGPWSQVQCASQAGVTTTTGFFQGDLEKEWLAEGGDTDIDSSGLPVSVPAGSRCPVPSASTMADIPTKYTGGRQLKMRADMLAKFEQMYAEAKKAGITLTITDAWRSEQTQIDRWNQYHGKSAVAKPCSMSNNQGGSNHNSGTAIDIALNSCRKTTQNCNDPIFLWMKKNGSTYGFKNTFPSTSLDNVHWSLSGR